MYGLLGLLLTSGGNQQSTASSEIYLLSKMLLPAVFTKPVTLTERTQEFQARQPDRKRENEQKSASSDSQSEASSRGNYNSCA